MDAPIVIPDGMVEVKVPGDGNCFFHVIGKATKQPHFVVRNLVVTFLDRMTEDEWKFLLESYNKREFQAQPSDCHEIFQRVIHTLN